MSKFTSLQQLHRRNFLIPVALVLAAGLLIAGLVLPVMTLKKLVFWKSTFSVLTGIQGLFIEGHWVLGVVILLFSVIFPIFKLTMLFQLWFVGAAGKMEGVVNRTSYD